jgi:hypothetical protein
LGNSWRSGDRIDAKWVRDVDPLHFFLPYLYPNRADNEAFMSETVDLTALEAFLEEKNRERTTDKYTLMHAISAAVVRTITLRPKMNQFIKGHRIYLRNELSLAFVIKKEFSDEGHEALAFLKFGPETTIDSLHAAVMKEVHDCRSDKLDNSTQGMKFFTKLPRWLMRIVMQVLFVLDYYGKAPQTLVKADPNYATVMMSNLGSIKLNSAYHHLSNWGTNSLFLVIGKKRRSPLLREDGTYEMRTVLNLGITLDERIADGYYYSKSIQILLHLLQHPELLNERADKEVIL